MPRKPLSITVAALLIGAATTALPSQAAKKSSDYPRWLNKHVGTANGKITAVVLKRARAHYLKKVREGVVKNPCYFAMDATRPSSVGRGPGLRFYVICEKTKTFRAVSSGYGNGRKLKRANFSNGRQCAKNFSNAEGSKLTMGGAYVTAESRTSFKGYYRRKGKRTPFFRTFILFEGEGDTENSRERDIGGHPAVLLRWQCRYKNPKSPHADKEGYVPFGRLVDYTGGRSNGCTTWSQSDSRRILKIADGNPTTVYIYPESRDINAVAKAVKKKKSLAGTGLYWNASCLRAIGTPKFWPKKNLQPIINAWRDSLPPVVHRPLPVCK